MPIVAVCIEQHGTGNATHGATIQPCDTLLEELDAGADYCCTEKHNDFITHMVLQAPTTAAAQRQLRSIDRIYYRIAL